MNRRLSSNFLINPKFQLSVIAHILGLQAIAATFLYLAIQRYFNRLFAESIASGLDPASPVFKLLENLQSTLSLVLFFTSIVTFFLTTVGGTWLSHKVAGPLHSLNIYLNNFDAKHSGPITFREGDYFPEIQHSVNKALKTKVEDTSES